MRALLVNFRILYQRKIILLYAVGITIFFLPQFFLIPRLPDRTLVLTMFIFPALLGAIFGEAIREIQVCPMSWVLPRFSRSLILYSLGLGLLSSVLLSLMWEPEEPLVLIAFIVTAWAAFHIHTVTAAHRIARLFFTGIFLTFSVSMFGVFDGSGLLMSFTTYPSLFLGASVCFLVLATVKLMSRRAHRVMCGAPSVTVFDMLNYTKMRAFGERKQAERLRRRAAGKDRRDRGFELLFGLLNRAPRYSVAKAVWGRLVRVPRGVLLSLAIAFFAFSALIPYSMLFFMVLALSISSSLAVHSNPERSDVLIPVSRRTRLKVSLALTISLAVVVVVLSAIAALLANLLVPLLPQIELSELTTEPSSVSLSLCLWSATGFFYFNSWVSVFGRRGLNYGVMAMLPAIFIGAFVIAFWAVSFEERLWDADLGWVNWASIPVIVVFSLINLWILRRKYLLKDLI